MLDTDKQAWIKVLDRLIAEYDKEIEQERKAREKEAKQSKDDSPRPVDIQPVENQNPEVEEKVEELSATDE